MKKLNMLPAIALFAFAGVSAQAQQSKVGIVNVQAAIVNTKDGQKAAADLQTKTAPKQKELESMQTDIQSLQAQLSKGSNTMSEEQRVKLTRDIDTKTKSFQRQYEDAKAEFDGEEQKVLQELSGRMIQVINKYAKDNQFTLIIDVSSQQTPVVFAAESIDITKPVIDIYDKNAPMSPMNSSAPAPKRPVTPAVTPK